MKKLIYISVLCVGMVGALTGCGGSKDSDATTEKVKEVESAASEEKKELPSSQEMADAMLDKGDFKDSLATVDNTMAINRLYMLDAAIVEEAAFYTNSNATAEEIAVIKVKDAESVETVKAAYETRVAEQKEACKDYLPDEMPKLEDAVIYSNGNYVILCVSNDSDTMLDIIEDFFE